MDIGDGSRKAEWASVAAASHAPRSNPNVAAPALVQSPPVSGTILITTHNLHQPKTVAAGFGAKASLKWSNDLCPSGNVGYA